MSASIDREPDLTTKDGRLQVRVPSTDVEVETELTAYHQVELRELVEAWRELQRVRRLSFNFPFSNVASTRLDARRRVNEHQPSKLYEAIADCVRESLVEQDTARKLLEQHQRDQAALRRVFGIPQHGMLATGGPRT